VLLAALCAFCAGARAATELDALKLPPLAAVTVDFDRDIKPIFESSCLRCHGSERPKSNFRLTNREAALRGGDNSRDDIVPGDSVHSRLIHYVAGLVEDMRMPPAGRGEALSLEQVGLLRAWIDQGVSWGATQAVAQTMFTASPTLRWISVRGSESKFRELQGVTSGWGGGLEHFELSEAHGPDTTRSAEGRFLFDEHDMRLKFAIQRQDVGFVHAGFEEWRRYYDDTGGYFGSFVVPSYPLDRDLHLDLGRAWMDFGLTLPHWPQMVLGYEYQFRDGAKSTLQWGTVDGKNIYPSEKDVNERTHILKFDLTHDLAGWRIEDSARVEFYHLRTSRDIALDGPAGGRPDLIERAMEKASHVEGANTLRVEKQLEDWWLVSGGYFFSKFQGDAALQQTTVDALARPTAGRFWQAGDVVLRRDSQVVSASSLLTPWKNLSASLMAQSEWTHQEGFSRVSLDYGDPNLPQFFFLMPATADSDLDKARTSENVALRFTGLPYTVLFGEARLEQERIDHFEQLVGDAPEAFLRDTVATNDRRDWRVGGQTSPWSWCSLTAHYRRSDSDSDYDHRRRVVFEGDGYSAFIRAREIQTDEVSAKLTLRPARWLKSTLTFQRGESKYRTTTDSIAGDISPGGTIIAGNYNARVFGLDLALMPAARLSLSGGATFSDARTTAAANGAVAVVPYDGSVLTVFATGSYALATNTVLQATYSFSRSDFGQDNAPDGLPLGLRFERHAIMVGVSRRFNDRVSANLRYGFQQYTEPGTDGGNDYSAHGVFAMLICRMP